MMLSVFGLSLDAVAERLEGHRIRFPEVQLTLESDDPFIFVAVSAAGSVDSMTTANRWVRGRLGSAVFSDAGKKMEEVVGSLLAARKSTVALAESCTGGLIADLMTDVPGSSDYFLFSAVTYSNQAKIEVLNVKAETLERYGAVSEQTAIEMASGARRITGADYGVATSGIAGPAGGTGAKPVGTVCIGLASKLEAAGHRIHIGDRGRRANKRIFAFTALDLLRQKLLEA